MRCILSAGFAAALLAACGGSTATGAAPDVAPAASASVAMRSFMRAAADSNLARMAQLWGTTDGPASQTGQPIGWEKRLIVMQAYLRGDSALLVSDVPVTGADNQRRLIVALWRFGCVKQIPATLTLGKGGGWLVQEVDIQAAGNPARPCEPDDDLLGALTR